ncbi:hypothetical protein TCSYLVIO_004290 [Trypanosoma cruzi]|nr:hypothetical protein TCSYLVIO_004290 [Trypanosoma cruzi]
MSTEDAFLPLRRIILGALAIFCAFAFGTLQSLDAVKLFSYLRANVHLRRIMGSCLVVNGVFFLSIWVASLLFSYMWTFGETFMWSSGAAVIDNESGGGKAAATMNGVSLAGKVWFSVFDVMWVLPVYALTQALGVRWYSALYTEAYAEKKRRASSLGVRWAAKESGRDDDMCFSGASQGAEDSFSLRSVAVSLSEIMFKALVTAVYALVAAVVDIIFPFPVGHYLAFIMNSWLYAFYVFDYRLSSQYLFDRRSRRHIRVTLSATLKFFEIQWAYFLGFGATHSIITAAIRSSWLASSWFSVASVTSVLFGAHIVISVEATPAPRAPFHVPMFTPFFAFCGMVLRMAVGAVR